jgi:Ulp1 family protease
MLLLTDRDELLCKMYPGRKSSHFFNNFFMERLVITDKAYKYSNVQRWTKKFDIFSKHKIVVPINLSNTHWTLAVVYMETREIHYYDSMSGRGELYLNALRSWVADEALHKRQETLDMSDWKLISREPHVPQQMNGTDCGVFTIVCADFVSDDLPLQYSQQQMAFFREKIGCDIMRGHLLYDQVAVRTE